MSLKSRRVHERPELLRIFANRFEFCHERGLGTHEHAGEVQRMVSSFLPRKRRGCYQ